MLSGCLFEALQSARRRDYVYFSEDAVVEADVHAGTARTRKRHMPQPPEPAEVAQPRAHGLGAALGERTRTPPGPNAEGALLLLTARS